MTATAFEAHTGRVYENSGNPALVALAPESALRVLDVGCGAGDNARLLARPQRQIWGITASEPEAVLARRHCHAVFVCDVEAELPSTLPDELDLICCSHVLEHLVSPERVLRALAARLRSDGLLIAAAPNMAHWRTRVQLLRGDFRRQDSGPFDRTHVQFWSYDTLKDPFTQAGLEVIRHTGDFALPQWPVRRLLPALAARVDRLVGPLVPNLAASQTLIVARRSTARAAC